MFHTHKAHALSLGLDLAIVKLSLDDTVPKLSKKFTTPFRDEIEGENIYIDIAQVNSKSKNMDLYGQTLTVSGWGFTITGREMEVPTRLKYTKMVALKENNHHLIKKVRDAKKIDKVRDTGIVLKGPHIVRDTEIILEGPLPGQGACKGDSGGKNTVFP